MGRSRSSRQQVHHLLADSPNPIYLLDDRRKILYCNPSCCEWLGLRADEVIGRQCDYHVGEGDLAAALCPPPETFAGQPQTAMVVWPRVGDIRERCVHFYPLGNSAADCIGVLAIAVGESREPSERAPSIDQLTSADLHRALALSARQQAVRFRLDRLVGKSGAIQRVGAQIEAAARSQARVNIVGPPGSGREHTARTIHAAWSHQQVDALLTPLACSLLDEDLFATTVDALVEYCRETDAKLCATLLLLDIDQLGAAAQERLWELCGQALPLRLLVTSHRPLLELAEQDTFHRDLAFGLSTLTIELPPLAARREDIPYLAQHLLENWNARGGKQMSGFVPEVLDRLMALPWSRNVDELAEVVNAACEKTAGVWIKLDDLPERVRMALAAASLPPPEEETVDLDQFLEEVERELIWRALKSARGNKSQAARLLNINRPRLLRRLEHLGLDQS